MKPSATSPLIYPWFRRLAGALGLCLVLASQSAALSLGPMLVRSDFGERFNAEILISAADLKNLKVSIGSPDDYRMLELERPTVVDRLYIKTPLKTEGDKVVLNVVSNGALFYPAFSLIIKVEQPQGTIYENYLITVDFQQSVSLRLKASRETDADEEARDQEAPSVSPGEEAPPESVAAGTEPGSGAPSEPGKPAPEEPQVAGVHPTPIVISQVPNPAHAVALPRPMPPVTTPVVQIPPPVVPGPRPETSVAQAPPAASVPEPAPEPVPDQETAPAPPVARAEPAPATTPAPALPGVARGGQPGVSPGTIKNAMGPVQAGDTLSSIVQSLEFNPADRIRVAAALWMDNQDQFISNNIHGLKVGAVLETEKLNDRLAQINVHEARWILQNHWQEWKLIRGGRPPERKIELDPALMHLLMPSEDNTTRNDLMGLVQRWKNTWEQEQLDAHMALFSRQLVSDSERARDGDFAYWQRFKKMMFARHHDVRIEVFQPSIVVLGNRAVMGFDQTFDSDKMKSFGRKEIHMQREPDGWKITKEIFSVKQFWDKLKMPEGTGEAVARFQPEPVRQHPFVVHASTQIDWGSALALVNGLRQLGFNAYAAPLYVSGTRKIYRVFVDRLAQWEAAEELAEILRQTDFAPFAIPIEFPYALEVGEFLDETRAREKMTQLHQQGLSSFLFSPESTDQPERTVKVILGAFFREDNARRMSEELAGKDIEWTLVAP